MTNEPCSRCGWRPIYARGYCKLDYESFRRTGKPRSEFQMLKDAQRYEVRLAAINARRQAERRLA